MFIFLPIINWSCMHPCPFFMCKTHVQSYCPNRRSHSWTEKEQRRGNTECVHLYTCMTLKHICLSAHVTNHSTLPIDLRCYI